MRALTRGKDHFGALGFREPEFPGVARRLVQRYVRCGSVHADEQSPVQKYGRRGGVPTHDLHGVHSPEGGTADAGCAVGETRVGVDQSGFDLEGGLLGPLPWR